MTTKNNQISYGHAAALSKNPTRALAAQIQTFDSQMVLGWMDALQMRKAVAGGLSPHTIRAYEVETNKFVHFMISFHGHTENAGEYLKLTTEAHAHEYVRLLFKTLAPASIKRALTALNSLFKYVHNKREITVQPFSNVGVSLPSSINTNMEDKALSEDELKIVFDACEKLPKETKRDLAVYHRTRWMLQLLFRSWQRRAEVANLRMCDFIKRKRGWEIRFVGKGNKFGLVMATPKLMDELAIYRVSIGLPPEPALNEIDIPVVGDVFNPMKPISDGAIYKAAKRMMFLSINSITGTDLESERIRKKLSECAVHTFRHTGVSIYMNNGGDLRLAQSQARHANVASTMIYDQRDQEKWRDDIERIQGKF